MRKGIWDALKREIGSTKYNHKGEPVRRGIGGWFCLGMKALGTVIFGGACLALALPLLGMATWVEAIVLCAAGLVLAGPFLHFHVLYAEAASLVMYVYDKVARGRSWAHYQEEAAEAAGPSTEDMLAELLRRTEAHAS